MSKQNGQIYEFDEFRLIPSERLLLREGEPVPLTPKVFETLVMLVVQSGHLVEKEQMLRRIWDNAFVEESCVARSIWTLRKALGENHNGHRFIQTVPKCGYRFVAKVRLINEAEPFHSKNGFQSRRAVLPLAALSSQVPKIPDLEIVADDFEASPAPKQRICTKLW